MGMHTTILGVIALATAVSCFLLKQWRLGIGLLLIGVSLCISFLIMIKSLPVDTIGVAVTLGFAIGCAMIVNTAIKAGAPAVAVCEKCKKGDRLVPIVYGYPRLSIRLASGLGRVKLGGCMPSRDNPKWFCKRCSIDI